MARVFPFRGIMFNESLKNQLGDFLCPPFDVVSEDLKEELYDLSEYNVIRLENGKIYKSLRLLILKYKNNKKGNTNCISEFISKTYGGTFSLSLDTIKSTPIHLPPINLYTL